MYVNVIVAWRSFIAGDHVETLKLLNEITAPTTGTDIINILKGNSYMMEVNIQLCMLVQ